MKSLHDPEFQTRAWTQHCWFCLSFSSMQSKQGALKERKLLVNMEITLGNIPGAVPGAPNSWTLIGVSLIHFPGVWVQVQQPSPAALHSMWPPYLSGLLIRAFAGELGDGHVPQGLGNLRNTRRHQQMQVLGKSSLEVEGDPGLGFGYLRQFFLLDLPLAKPPKEPQEVKQEERTILEVLLCLCAQGGLGCSPAWAFCMKSSCCALWFLFFLLLTGWTSRSWCSALED